jgi:hypothetical protein
LLALSAGDFPIFALYDSHKRTALVVWQSLVLVLGYQVYTKNLAFIILPMSFLCWRLQFVFLPGPAGYFVVCRRTPNPSC